MKNQITKRDFLKQSLFGLTTFSLIPTAICNTKKENILSLTESNMETCSDAILETCEGKALKALKQLSKEEIDLIKQVYRKNI